MLKNQEENWLFKKLDKEKEIEIYDEIGSAILKKLDCPKALSESSFRKKIGYAVLKALENQALPLFHVRIPDYMSKKEREQLETILNKMGIRWIITANDISINLLEKAKVENINLKKKSWIKRIFHIK